MHQPKSLFQLMARTLLVIFLLLGSLGILRAQNTATVTTNAGDQSAGSLGAAIATLNGEGSGTVTFNISPDDPLTLTQPLPAVSNSVTFQGDGSTGNATIVGQTGSAAQLFFQQNFTLANNLQLMNNLTLGQGLDVAVTAASWTLASGGSLNMAAGTGAEIDATNGSNLVGWSGGNASVTVGNWAVTSIAGAVINGGTGGAVNDQNGIGDQGGQGGNSNLFGNSLTITNASNLSLNGGLGGNAADTNNSSTPLGGSGGSAAVSFGSLSLDTNSNFVITGGKGGFAVSGGSGGQAAATIGSAFLSGSTFKVIGGVGRGGLEAGGSGGAASVTFSSFSEFNQTSVQSVFVVSGGNGDVGETGAGDGGNAGLTGTTAAVTNSQFQVAGGNGGNLGNTPTGPFNGGNGGSASVSLGTFTSDGGAFLSVAGGSGGIGGSQTNAGNGGQGGNGTLNVGSLSLGNSVQFYVQAGSGGTGGDGTLGGDGGNGGNAAVTVNNLTMTTGSIFGAAGGAGGNAGSSGVNGTEGTSSVVIDTLNGTGAINLSGLNGGTLELQDGDFSGTLNAGTLLHDSGSFTLDGSGSLSAGASFSGGTFVLGDSSSPNAILNGAVTVDGSGTLQGYGRANGVLTNNGTVEPGNGSPSGFLTTTQYNQTSGGELDIFIAPGNNNSNNLIITGGADLAGILQVNPTGSGYGFRDRYDFISGAPVTGTFDTFGDPGVSGMSATLLYGSNSVTLILLKSGVDFTAYAKTANELSVATALNASLLTSSDAFISKAAELDGLSTGQSAVLDQLGGILYTALPGALLDNLQFENDLLFNHLGVGGFSGPRWTQDSLIGNISSSEAGAKAQKSNASAPSQGFWLQNTDSFGSTSPAKDITSFSKSSYGFVGGYDWKLSSHWIGGILGGYLHNTVTPDGFTDTAGISGIQMGLYGKASFGLLDISALGGCVLDRFTVDRSIDIGSNASQVSGVYNGSQIQGALRMDLRLTDADTTFKPFWGIQYAHLSEAAFTESGLDSGSESLGLILPAQSYDSLRPYAGLGETWSLKIGKESQLSPEIHASVSQELMEKTPGFQAGFTGAPGENFQITGAAADTTLFGAGAGLQLSLGKDLRFFSDFEGHFNSTDNLSIISGGMNLSL